MSNKTPTHVIREGQEMFREVVAKIVEVVAPEKIICFGGRISYQELWSRFVRDHGYDHFTNYDLLIVTSDFDQEKEHEILDKIKTHRHVSVGVTAIVHTISAVNKAIQDGNWFFTKVCREGTMPYDNDKIPLAIPRVNLYDPQTVSQHESIEEKVWNQSIRLAKKYHKLSGMCINPVTESLNDMSMLMLHHAVALGCRAIIRYWTSYVAETHNLQRLLSLTKIFTWEVEGVFPQGTKEEKELFGRLKCAYDKVHHVVDYKIDSWTVSTLRDRVEHFLEVVEKLHGEKKNYVPRPGL